MEAYSGQTNTHYKDWDALVTAEGNGFVIVGTSTRPNTVPIVVGPYSDEAEARRAQARLRRRWRKKEREEHGSDVQVKAYLRVLWKEDPATEYRALPDPDEVLEHAEAVVYDVLTDNAAEGMDVLDFAALVVRRLLESGTMTVGSAPR